MSDSFILATWAAGQAVYGQIMRWIAMALGLLEAVLSAVQSLSDRVVVGHLLSSPP